MMKKAITMIILCLVSGCSNRDNILQGYLEGKYTYLSAAISGKLEILKVARGDYVKTGDLMFVLDQQPETAKLAQAEHRFIQTYETLSDLQKGQRQTILEELTAQKEQVLANLDFQKITLSRYNKLFAKKVIDKATVDQAFTNYQNSVKKIKEIDASIAEAKLGARENQINAQREAVKATTAEVNQAQWALTQKTIYAPISGQVFDTYFRTGEFVQEGQPVISILAPENLKLIVFVPENKLGKIKIGQSITFKYDGCHYKYTATIDFISSKAEYTPPVIYSVTSRDKLVYRVEARIPKDYAKSLHAGQPVDVSF